MNEPNPQNIDWDNVDLGERRDNLPLRKPGRMPWPARVGLVVAIVMMACGIVGVGLMLFIG